MVQWWSSNIYIFEPVFFSESSNPWVFIFFFFSFSYSFSGQFELPSAVTNNGGSRRGSEQIISFYRDIQEKIWKDASEISFLYHYNGAQKHGGFVCFEKACSRAKTYVILTSLNYVHFYTRYCWWRQFLWRLRMRICKIQKPCINSAWIAW